MNDFGELNIDKYLIENEDEFNNLSHKWLSCNLNDDLGDSLNFMLLSITIKAVILESSGVALNQ